MNSSLTRLKDEKVLILGFGKEGQSTYKFLRKYFPGKKLGIADKAELSQLGPVRAWLKDDSQANLHLGEKYLETLYKYQVVFKTPGIPHKLPEIKEAKKRGIEFTSQTKLFFELCRGKIIGVTGTKGKSTAATLIHKILQAEDLRSVLLGNIGKPALDYLDQDSPNTIFVFELSSHQLSDLERSPHIAVFLNIYKEHLDYYENFNQYLDAKENITKYQSKSDYLIYNLKDQRLERIAARSKAKKLAFSFRKTASSKCFLEENYIVFREKGKEEKMIKLKEIHLKGRHNLNNIMAAVIVGKTLGVGTKNIRQSVKDFHPLEHRLEEIGTYKGIRFINDALATIPEATIAAIEAPEGKVGTIILGGSDRGQDFGRLADVILENKIETLILFPTTGKRIWREIERKIKTGFAPKHFFVGNMKDAVELCFEKTPQGKICLLSTASPSFSLFRDYEEKAKLFKRHVDFFGENRE